MKVISTKTNLNFFFHCFFFPEFILLLDLQYVFHHITYTLVLLPSPCLSHHNYTSSILITSQSDKHLLPFICSNASFPLFGRSAKSTWFCMDLYWDHSHSKSVLSAVASPWTDNWIHPCPDVFHLFGLISFNTISIIKLGKWTSSF